MSDGESKFGDLLGIAPVSRAVERVTDSVMSGAEAILGRVCLPAAEELGLLFRDKVSAWRQRNAIATIEKARNRLETAAADNRHAHPRLLMESVNHASWTDNEEVQNMWAGLLVSSCTADGKDESNWIFINLLRQLTSMQVHILKYACEQAEKVVQNNGLIAANSLFRTDAELITLTHCQDVHRIDRELDHLRALGLIERGFSVRGATPLADIEPTALGLHLYVRSQGSLQGPIEFFGLSAPKAE